MANSNTEETPQEQIERRLATARFQADFYYEQVKGHRKAFEASNNLVDWFKWSSGAIDDACRFQVWRTIVVVFEDAQQDGNLDRAEKRLASYERTAIQAVLGGTSTSVVSNETERRFASVWNGIMEDFRQPWFG